MHFVVINIKSCTQTALINTIFFKEYTVFMQLGLICKIINYCKSDCQVEL